MSAPLEHFLNKFIVRFSSFSEQFSMNFIHSYKFIELDDLINHLSKIKKKETSKNS